MELAESYARYAVRYWLLDPLKDDLTDSLVRTRVYYALRRADIPLSMPAQSLFVTKESPRTREQRSADERQKRLEALASIDLFDGLEAQDKERLAQGLRYAPFTSGEVLTRQGDQAHWLYLIVEGQAQVSVRGESGQERAVAQLRPGDVFGEMALLTGAPRSATVTATTDIECYRLDKAVFQEVIQRRPELAEQAAAILAQRTVGLEAARQQLDADVREKRLAAAKHDLVSRIRHFFGLGETGGSDGA